MLQIKPYTPELIPIGNAPHYNGQQVYTDGRVAYGWVYNQQKKLNANQNPAGFWVGEESVRSYQLAKKNLTLGTKIVSRGHGDIQAYPTWATISNGPLPEYGKVNTAAGAFLYNGAIIAIDGTGNLLTYDWYCLNFYTPGARETDGQNHTLSIGEISIIDDNSYVLWLDTAYIAQYEQNGHKIKVIYDTDMTVVATVEDNTVRYKVGYPDEYIGDGEITVRGSRPLLTVQKNNIDMSDLRSMAGVLTGIMTVDGIRLNIDPTDARSANIDIHERSTNIRKYFLAKATETYMAAITPDRDNDGHVIYSGDYTLHVDILIGSGQNATIVEQNNETYIYENGTLVASETSTGYIHTYGAIVYNGPGRIDTDNITPDPQNPGTYTGDYTIFKEMSRISGAGKIVPNGDDLYVYTFGGVEVAHEDNTDVIVYEGATAIYTGPGNIATSQLTPSEYRGNYTIRRDLTGYSTRIINPMGNVEVYDGWLHAIQNGQSVTIEDNGQVIYSGAGWIDTNNLTPDPTDPSVYSGTYTVRWDISGVGRIVPQNNDIYVYDLITGNIIANENGNDVTVYTPSGTVEWTGSGWIDTSNLVVIAYIGQYEVNTVNGTTGSGKIIHNTESTGNYTIRRDITGNSDYILNPTGNIELFDGALHVTQNGQNITIQKNNTQIYQGAGQIILSNVTQTSPPYYSGDYTIRWDITGSSAKIVEHGDNIYLYNGADLIAKESGGTVTVYQNGQVEWSGAGWIDTTDVVTAEDIYIFLDAAAIQNDDPLAKEDGDMLYVYGTQPWSGYGHITTVNETVDRSVKRYHIDAASGITEQQYPATWQVGTDAEIDLSNMNLTVREGQQQHTYRNDPLELLATQEYIYAGGVHAWRDFVISQDSGLIWHAQQTATYTGIADCFSLEWLTKRW